MGFRLAVWVPHISGPLTRNPGVIKNCRKMSEGCWGGTGHGGVQDAHIAWSLNSELAVSRSFESFWQAPIVLATPTLPRRYAFRTCGHTWMHAVDLGLSDTQIPRPLCLERRSTLSAEARHFGSGTRTSIHVNSVTRSKDWLPVGQAQV